MTNCPENDTIFKYMTEVINMYQVSIAQFEGPLDLLLHLLKEKEMDIFDIEIGEITKQYLSYIRNLEALHLEVASEYLVMAAYLIEIKSKMLLPIEKEVLEDAFEEDPREQLIKQLLEYKKFKELSSMFKEFEYERQFFFTKASEDLSVFLEEEEMPLEPNFDLYDLAQAMQKILSRIARSVPQTATVTKKEWSVEERMTQLTIRLKQLNKNHILFEELLEVEERGHCIVTFLALLSMAKTQAIQLNQSINFETIEILVMN